MHGYYGSKRRIPATLLVCALVFGGHACAQPSGASEAALKAAFVYNFAKFVEWSNTDANLSLCVLGKGNVPQALANLDGKSAQSREIKVKSAVAAADLKGCHITWVASGEEARISEVLKSARGAGMLTVSDADGFADSGGIIGLVVTNGRVQFEYNAAAAQRAGVKVSAHLAKLARSIKGDSK